MEPIVDAFAPAFMYRAIIGSLIAVVVTSLVGTWVVLRGLAFLGDALAHGDIPGMSSVQTRCHALQLVRVQDVVETNDPTVGGDFSFLEHEGCSLNAEQHPRLAIHREGPHLKARRRQPPSEVDDEP